MIEIIVSDEVLLEARKQAVEMGKLNNSITKGQGNVAGFVGELVTAELLNGTQKNTSCLLYTSPSPRDGLLSRMPSSA